MDNDLIEQLNYIKGKIAEKDTLDSLAYSIGFLEMKYPELSEFLDFILMQDKRVNENLELKKMKNFSSSFNLDVPLNIFSGGNNG